jgi:glycerol-3-phosphate dehydrogenase
LEGTEKVLPTQSYIFNPSSGTVTVGRPIVAGNLKENVPIPESFDRLPLPTGKASKNFIIDNLALIVGRGLHQHRHGTYRNLYKGDIIDPRTHELIKIAKKPREKIVVLGHSPMGTAMSTALANKDVEIKIFINDQETADINNEKACDLKYFPLFKLPPNIKFTAKPECLSEATIFVQAESPWMVDDLLRDDIERIQKSDAPIVNIAKGLSSSKTGLVLNDIQENYNIPKERLAAIAGAVIPYQLMERKLSGQEIAAYDTEVIKRMLPIFNTGYLYTRQAINPNDVIGVQLGSALKTMYAIGIGLLDGYFEQELGGKADNTIFHITNLFFRELKKLGVTIGAKETTFDGLSGITDFILSCFGDFGIDRDYGYQFAKGNKDPKPCNGLYSLRILPSIIDIDGYKFPVLKSIYGVVIKGEDIGTTILMMQTAAFSV